MTTIGEFRREPARSWKRHPDQPANAMRCYLGMTGRVTVQELHDHFAEHYPHVDVRTVELNYATAVWEEPPTAEDIARHEEWKRSQAERTEAWERRTYAALKAKFEPEAALADPEGR